MSRCQRSYYHYTRASNLRQILHEAAILPGLDPLFAAPYGPPPKVCWFSCASPWEPICGATMALAPDTWPGHPRGIVPGPRFEAARIRVPAEITEPWDVFLAKRGAHWSAIMRLAQTGHDYKSDPWDWRVCEGPVTADTWLTVEIWDGERWRCVPRADRVYTVADLDAFLAGIAGPCGDNVR